MGGICRRPQKPVWNRGQGTQRPRQPVAVGLEHRAFGQVGLGHQSYASRNLDRQPRTLMPSCLFTHCRRRRPSSAVEGLASSSHLAKRKPAADLSHGGNRIGRNNRPRAWATTFAGTGALGHQLAHPHGIEPDPIPNRSIDLSAVALYPGEVSVDERHTAPARCRVADFPEPSHAGGTGLEREGQSDTARFGDSPAAVLGGLACAAHSLQSRGPTDVLSASFNTALADRTHHSTGARR
jgi:hypothetical protein